MNSEKLDKHEFLHYEDHPATQKDLKILGLEIDGKMLNLKMELKMELK